ncbi:MAG: helix-turn-helix domain-containing protein [Chitinispirillia bacterium]|nr:helix-turn-helix domain-containing protein [Chitinispirillia bacterium]MCL2269384.1 helix-turn-helix domain-containing protein [Chitinispirillia bacterium]
MRLITAEEVQVLFRLKSIQTIYRWARDGRIRAVRFGARGIRFCAEEIENIMHSGTPFINLKAGRPIAARAVAHRRVRAWE